MKDLKIKAVFLAMAVLSIAVVCGEGTFSLVEINPLHGSSPLTTTSDSAKTYYGAGALTDFIEMNGKLYFSAQGTPGDDELWVTDGTQAGTSVVKSINPGHGAGIGNLVLLGNRILFMATDNDSTWDLWSSDGTEGGTLKIDTLNQAGNNALGPNSFAVLDNRVIFCSKEKVLSTDGTASGTDSLISIANYQQGYGYCDLSNQSFFVLPETGGGSEIWRTDGTTHGTWPVIELDTTSFNIASVTSMLAFNGKLYLAAADSGQAPDLFTFDGNVNGKLNRIVIAPGGNSSPHGFKDYNGSLYFIADNGTATNIYVISSTDSVPHALIPNSNFNALTNLTIANNTAYCMGPDRKQIQAVELSTLTYSNLSLQGYSLPDFYYVDSTFLVGLNQHIFFEAYDSLSGKQVFMQSDFTPAGTTAVMPADANTIHPFNSILNGGIQDVFDFKLWGNKVIVPANFDDAGRELWIYDPNAVNGVETLKGAEVFSIYPNPTSSELIIKTVLGFGQIQQLDVVDADGQKVLQQTLQAEVTTIRLSTLSPGSYFITLSQNGKPVGTQKLLLIK